MSLASIVWLGLLVLFVLAEGFTSALVSIWFCTGALAALVVSLFAPGAYLVQALVFAAVSLLCLIALRPLAKRWIDTRRVPTNADANIGKTGQVIAEIQPGHFGRVRLEGLDWLAKADTVLPVGTRCLVVGLEGVKLIVIPAQYENTQITHP